MRIYEVKTVLLDYFPKDLKEGIIYISNKYHIANHLCACGCGLETITPLNDIRGWKLELNQDKATLTPSIGNQNFPCKSHYYITDGKINWL